jgi:hypothetical protein
LEFLLAEKPLEGFHVVVDAGNGAGGFFAVSFHFLLIFNFVLHIMGVRISYSQLYGSFNI